MEHETDLTDLHRWGCSFAPFVNIMLQDGGGYYRRVLFYLQFVCVATKTPFFKQNSPRFFPFLKSFRYICNIVPQLQRWYGMTLTKRCYWNYLLRSNFATLINSMKMMAVAPHLLIHTNLNRSVVIILVWAIVLSML